MFYYPAEPLLLIWKALIWKLPSELLILFRVPVMPWPEISKKFQIIFFIVTPESIEISGDIQEVISSGIRIPAFHDNYQG